MKCWCWSLRSVFMHLYIKSTIHVHERTWCFHFLLRGRFTGTSYWRWKGSQLHPLRFKNTMLLTPWCQKLEHYHFKSNLKFKAKEIKIRAVLFLVLKPMNCREAWNSPTISRFIFCMALYNATCYIKPISQCVCDFSKGSLFTLLSGISPLFLEIRIRLLEDATQILPTLGILTALACNRS